MHETLKAALRPVRRQVMRLLSANERLEWFYDRAMVLHHYRRVFQHTPDLNAPTTFNEKIAYKRLYDRRPILTRVTDKVAVREYVGKRIGEQYLAKLHHTFDAVDDVDPAALPRSFVLKPSHASGRIMRVPDKSKWDFEAARPMLRKWLTYNFYWHLREWSYRDIPPRLMVEEHLGDNIRDWKFFVYDGKVHFVDVHFDRYIKHTRNVYDRNLKRLPVRILYENHDGDPTFENMGLMFELVETLGRGFDFIRVDMYNIEGRIVFGELTNYSGAGLEPFIPTEYDKVFGEPWRVPSG
jgi:hypothetical protein